MDLYIEYLKADKNFEKTKVIFRGVKAFDNAVKWGRKNLENFNLDQIKTINK